MRPLAPRERRLLAIGLLLAAVAVAWLAIVSPLVGGFFARADERRELIAAYGRNQRTMAQTATWRALADQQRKTGARFAMAAPSEPLAVEALKERVVKLAADEGFTVSALSDLAADAPPGKIRLRCDLQLTLTQLYESLKRLETEGPYVVVEYLAVSADRALATGRSSPLAVRLEITATYRPQRARAS
ncbi:MAG: type II secretion system protein GspM [Caulobacteraceae bacterium]